MSDKTAIEWTDHTFNPWWGCTKVSPGCDHCYAEAWAKRTGWKVWGANAPRRMFDGDGERKHWREPYRWNRQAEETGTRHRVFCASMADVFEKHPAIENERDELWTLIHKTPHLDWQLLTKRIGNVARMVPPSWMNGHWPGHAWIGASIVNQEEADRDIPKLLALPARVRFLSCEPLLGPVDIAAYLQASRVRMGNSGPVEVHGQPTLAWVIAGGESGSKARPAHPGWFSSLRDQCKDTGVPFLFKQWGEWAPASVARRHDAYSQDDVLVKMDGTAHTVNHDDHERYDASDVPMLKVGKKLAGRTLDGRTHDGYPA